MSKTPASKLPGSSPDDPLITVLYGFDHAGKSVLVHRACQDRFVESPESLYQEQCRFVVGASHVEVNDTGPSDFFPPLIKLYIRTAHAALVLFSVTSQKSFQCAKTFAAQLVQFRDPVRRPIPLVLLATQIDRASERVVSPEEAQAFADTLGVPYVETSAKTGEGVREAFEEAVRLVRFAKENTNTDDTDKRCALQ